MTNEKKVIRVSLTNYKKLMKQLTSKQNKNKDRRVSFDEIVSDLLKAKGGKKEKKFKHFDLMNDNEYYEFIDFLRDSVTMPFSIGGRYNLYTALRKERKKSRGVKK